VSGAFFWAFLGQCSLLLGAVIALRLQPNDRVVGLVMGFGSGVLISAVSYELVEGAVTTSAGSGGVAFGLLAGSAVYFVGDTLLARRFGDEAMIDGLRRDESDRPAPGGTGLAIAMGATLDGIPESMVLGLTLVGGGGVGIAVLAAIFISNLPEGIAATAELRSSGWPASRIVALWLGITVLCAVAAAVGFAVFADAAPHTIAFVDAFAGGAILTMLASTMMPQAFKNGGRLVGPLTTLGFIVAFFLRGLG
jgi:ZIP family zinc transporter